MDDAAATDTTQIAVWLPGEWAVTRSINDGAGRFEGRASFAWDPDSPAALIWHEHGRLRLGAHDGPVERTLRIEPAGGGAWEVRFADGRPFHALDLTSGSCEALHLCGPDTYRGRYAIDDRDRFSVTWRVTGPRRDDLIASLYERAA